MNLLYDLSRLNPVRDLCYFFFFQAEDGIRDYKVTGVQTCALPISSNIVISVHCHNDLGLAVANSLEAIRAGAGQVECTVNGIGERAGNAALEEIVMALKHRQADFDADTGVRTEEIIPTSSMLVEITGVPVQPNKAVVGSNAFAHES